MDPETGSADIFPRDPFMPHGFGVHFLSHIASFIDNSKYMSLSGSLALQETFNFVSKFAGALIFWLSSGSNSNLGHRISGSPDGSYSSNFTSKTQVKRVASCGQNFSVVFFDHRSKGKPTIPFVLGAFSKFSVKQFCKDLVHLQSLPVLSLAAALVPPFDNVYPDILPVQVETSAGEAERCMNQRPCEVEHRGCSDISFECLSWAIEPITGIEFPTVLESMVAGEDNSNFSSEVLVGTGSRIMKIIRIKSLKVYAFGFYVHPFDVCEKLGPKYASIPVYELNKCRDFYEDLLREDINMSVKLVVSCDGIKIGSVRDAFEKSLRARLVKTNPDTDYSCLQKFGSIFAQDIPLHVGTTINFRRTAEGCLITEIDGNQLGVVPSKELCRAFFDMYIGDIPVSEETKQEIGKNVASILKRC